jgi:hypothetical protein
LVHNLIYRIAPGASQGAYEGGHKQGPLYYIINGAFASEILPWFVAIPAVVHWLWRKRMPQEWNRPALIFLAVAFPVGLLILSVPGTKRQMYLLPMIAPLGVVVGAWIAATVRKEFLHAIDRVTHLILLVAVAVLFVAGVVFLILAKPLIAHFVRDRDIMPIGSMSPVLYVLLCLLGLLVVLLATYGVRLWRRRFARVGALMAWTILVFYVIGGTIAYQVADPPKNLHRMTDDLRKMGVFAGPLAGYRLDETTRCVIPFDSGRQLENFSDRGAEDALKRFMRDHPSGKLLVLERNLPRGPVFPDLRLVGKWTFSNHRVYCLYEFSPAPPTENKPG